MPQSGGHAPHEAGSSPDRALALEDATAVARLRAAGFIVIATTNLSEVCLWYESDNPVYGRTGNPYDIHRTCGGSSGGEGAVVGAGVTPVGLGSDIGGSIRMPAHFCGVFGHKPTGGLVPNTGQIPYGPTRLCTTGPIAAHAEDLWPLLHALSGSDGLDASCRSLQVLSARSSDAKAERLQLTDGTNGAASGKDVVGVARSMSLDSAEGPRSAGCSSSSKGGIASVQSHGNELLLQGRQLN